MATVVNYKEKRGSFRNKPELVKVVYDFAKDAGATGVLDLLKVRKACIVRLAYLKVITTCTSGGSATVSAGKSSDVAGLIAQQAVASLVAGFVAIGATTVDASHVLAADAVIQQDIGTAALTAGKIEYAFEIQEV